MVGIRAQGTFMEVIQALYGLSTFENRWHAHLLHTWREMGFEPIRFDPDVWIREREGGYDYIGTPTDDVLVVAVDPTFIFDNLKETYIINAFGPPKVHIGCDYTQVKKGDKTWWVMGFTTYNTECLRKVCALLKVTNLWKEKLPYSPGEHPELYSSALFSEAQNRLYQQLVGMGEWAVQIGRFGIRYALTSLNRFSAGPREGHISHLVKIFGYL